MNSQPLDTAHREAQPSKQISATTALTGSISQTLIIAYKESTEQLEAALDREGLPCQVLRQKHQAEYKDYSPSYLCLLNHRRAWEMASREDKPTLVVEADFVPVLGMGELPLPFDSQQESVGIAWLYTCAPQVYFVSAEGYAEGFSVSSVAYVVTPRAAAALLELETQVRQNPGPTAYSPWDSTIDDFLRARKFRNYIPFRNYGEHGGLPNLEHQRFGLSKTHRADCLYGKLAFVPPYANVDKPDYLGFFAVRLQARLKGIGRLALGRFLRPEVAKGSSYPFRLLSFAIRRQLSWRI